MIMENLKQLFVRFFKNRELNVPDNSELLCQEDAGSTHIQCQIEGANEQMADWMAKKRRW